MQSKICMCWGPESVDPRFSHPMMGVTWVPWRSCICRWYKLLLTLTKNILLPIPIKWASHTSRPNSKKWPGINKEYQGGRWPREGMTQGAGMGEVAVGHWQKNMANSAQFLLTSSAVPDDLPNVSLFLPFSLGEEKKKITAGLGGEKFSSLF